MSLQSGEQASAKCSHPDLSNPSNPEEGVLMKEEHHHPGGDYQAIANLKAAYIDAADGGWTGEPPHDGEAIAQLFVQDGCWDAGEIGKAEGREEIRSFFEKAIEAFPMVFHHTSSPRIEVEGDAARGQWHVMVPMIDRDQPKLLIGIYEDDFVRTEGGWRFKRLSFTRSATLDLPNGWRRD